MWTVASPAYLRRTCGCRRDANHAAPHPPLLLEVGALHDVVEDTAWTFEQLRQEGFADDVLVALERVAKHPNGEEAYATFIERAGQDPVALEVKIADLQDNMDLTRIAAPTERDHQRIRKYRAALETLTSQAAP